MTRNQRIFADEYLRNGRNATKAYKKAYPRIKKDDVAAACGAKLLREDAIAKYIDKVLSDLHDGTIADAKEIMQFYTAIMRGELPDRKVVEKKDGGIEVIEVPVKMSERSSAAERLSRMLGIDRWIDSEKYEHIDKERLRIEQARLDMEIARAKAEEEAEGDGITILDDIYEYTGEYIADDSAGVL
jgi:phage terminase small subunit